MLSIKEHDYTVGLHSNSCNGNRYTQQHDNMVKVCTIYTVTVQQATTFFKTSIKEHDYKVGLKGNS